MKMMSMTSKTSISGVTLISEERPWPPEVPFPAGLFIENAIAGISQCRIGQASTPLLQTPISHKKLRAAGQPAAPPVIELRY
jgi:hypothetical protein